MIRDARHRLLTPLWHRYVRYRLAHAFRGLWVNGALPGDDEPLILYANHSNFWDGFVAHSLVHHSGRDGYVVMEEQNLLRFRFLTRLGAMSIRRGDRASALETLRHARAVLERPRATLLFFPQGRIETTTGPAPRFERGLEVLGRMSGARAVPLALRYAFFEHEYPDVLMSVGAVHPVTTTADCEARMQAQLAFLAALPAPGTLEALLEGRRSVAEVPRWRTQA
ncbi:MAG: lysophospholipid acyltransferase family protein [Archangiaceae bacterium]|nr:lysophospholipid acyltransferase family protein [Archangiaceae bacterium]